MSKIIKRKNPVDNTGSSTKTGRKEVYKKVLQWKDKRDALEKAIDIDANNLKKLSVVADSIWHYNKDIDIDIPVNELIHTLVQLKMVPTNIKDLSAQFLTDKILDTKIDLEQLLRFRDKMNTSMFEGYVRGRFQDNVIGYCVQAFQDNKRILLLEHGQSKNHADGYNAWTHQTKMHIASLTKFISSLGLAKAMELKQIAYTEPIYKYLPSYWNFSANAKKVTFHHILKHISGFTFNGSVQHYKDIKGIMQGSLHNFGNYEYCNANFGIIRILIPIIMGDIKANFLANQGNRFSLNFPVLNLPILLNKDIMWDIFTMNNFRKFMMKYLFQPAGVNNFTGNSDLSKISGYPANLVQNKAYGYTSATDNTKGMDSGDLSSSIGGYGLRLSVEELDKILKYGTTNRNFIKKGSIEKVLSYGYGINHHNTVKGIGYVHGGSWAGGEGAEVSLQCILPEGIRIEAFVNSSLDNVSGGIYDAILTGYNLAME